MFVYSPAGLPVYNLCSQEVHMSSSRVEKSRSLPQILTPFIHKPLLN